MKYAFIKNNLVGNIVDESKVSTCPADHTAVELVESEKCRIFWLYSPTETPRFKPQPTFDSGLYNIGVSENNGILNWELTKKTNAEISEYIKQQGESAVQHAKYQLWEKEVETKYNENLATIATLNDEAALEVAIQFPPFNPDGHPYKAKNEAEGIKADRFYYPVDGKLYKVSQNHTSQPDWLPGEAVSLYTEVVPPGEIPEWNADDYASYELGTKVSHNGKTWQCIDPTYAWIEPGSQDGHNGWKEV